MTGFLIDTSVALALLNVLIAGVVIGNRFLVRSRQRRYTSALQRLRPAVLEWMEGDGVVLPRLEGIEQRALLDLLGKFGRSLRGDQRRRVADLALAGGYTHDLAVAATSRRPWRRAAAAYRLGDIGSGDAELLVALLGDDDRRVRNAAARSLGRQGALEGVEPIVVALATGRVARAIGGQALLDIGSPAADGLAQLLDSRIREVRATAAELLGRLGGPEHARILAQQLNHPDAEVRVAVVRALGRLGGRAAARSVAELLDDPVAYVRAAAATATARLGGAAELDKLITMAIEDEFLPANAAAGAATELDPGRVVRAAAATGAPHLVEAADLVTIGSS